MGERRGERGTRGMSSGAGLGPSEATRQRMGGVAIELHTRSLLEKLAATEPRTLALMHGSSYRGDGGVLLRGLADALGV